MVYEDYIRAKGSKPITWSITSTDLLVSLGLSFDQKAGILKGKPIAVTSDDTQPGTNTDTENKSGGGGGGCNAGMMSAIAVLKASI